MGKVLTIAMPCYNVERYLRHGLDSLADERLVEDVEVIVVDDGSTDSTAQIAQGYVDRMPELFRLVSKQNGGHGSAVNAGIDNARGRYFRVVDGDDWVDTEGLVRVVELLKASTADIFVDEKCEVDMSTNARTPRPLTQQFRALGRVAFASVCDDVACEDYLTIHTLSVKTELLRSRDVRLHEGIFYVDLQYVIMATCYAGTVQFAPVEVYQYLLGNAEQSVAFSSYANRYEDHAAMVRDILAFADEGRFKGAVSSYLDNRVRLALHTHFNIALVYDEDRSRGLRRAKEFRSWLAEQHPRFEAMIRSRYRKTLLLHYLGVDGPRLNKMMGR